jgi:hypothetical protein
MYFRKALFFKFDFIFIEKIIKKHGRPESHLRINSELMTGVFGGFFSLILLCHARAAHQTVFSADLFSSRQEVVLEEL